jgi:hypothetical protein
MQQTNNKHRIRRTTSRIFRFTSRPCLQCYTDTQVSTFTAASQSSSTPGFGTHPVTTHWTAKLPLPLARRYPTTTSPTSHVSTHDPYTHPHILHLTRITAISHPTSALVLQINSEPGAPKPTRMKPHERPRYRKTRPALPLRLRQYQGHTDQRGVRYPTPSPTPTTPPLPNNQSTRSHLLPPPNP